MASVTIVAEGPDDLAALRALLKQEPGGSVEGSLRAASSPMKARGPGWEAELYIAQGKSTLAERTFYAAQGTAASRPEIIVVCFDPDRDPPPSEFDFFATQYRGCPGATVAPLTWDGSSAGWIEIGGRRVRIVAGPWRLDAAARFDDLPDEQNLERVLVTGLLGRLGACALTRWAEGATSDLVRERGTHGWKRAFRILNAAICPKSEACVDGLLQDPDVGPGCLAALRTTKAWESVRALLSAG
jgi:hypothetical protein